MITTRIQIADGEIADTYAAHGLIYLEADKRTAPPMRQLDVSTYAEDDGEHADPRFTWAPFDYKVTFLIEAPNRNLSSANARIAAFNAALYESLGSGDVKRLRRVTFYNDRDRVKICGLPTPIAEPKELYRRQDGSVMDCAKVELTIRVDRPPLCDFNVADVMRGSWLPSATEEQWRWLVRGEYKPVPTDAASLRFDFHAGETSLSGSALFVTGNGTDEPDIPLATLDDVPASLSGNSSYNFTFLALRHVTSLPQVDFSGAVLLNAVYSICSSLTHLGRLNTQSVSRFVFTFNRCSHLTTIGGLWLDSAGEFTRVFNGCPSLTTLTLHNLGMGPCLSYDFECGEWGAGSVMALRSLRDSLLTLSFDRAAAGLAPATLLLPDSVIARLSDDDLVAVTAKGFNIASRS